MIVPFSLTPEDVTFVLVLISLKIQTSIHEKDNSLNYYQLFAPEWVSDYFFLNTGFYRGDGGQMECDGYRVSVESLGEDDSGVWKNYRIMRPGASRQSYLF